MIIIVEGLDNTGKSTLIKNLRKYVFKHPMVTSIHCTSPPYQSNSQWSKDHYNEILRLSRDMSMNGWVVILDRSHLGEDVFGPIFRNESVDYIYDLEYSYFVDVDVRAILLIDDPANLIERDDGQSHTINRNDLQNVSDRFVDVFKKSHINHKMVYHITNDGGFTHLLSTVMEFLECKH